MDTVSNNPSYALGFRGPAWVSENVEYFEVKSTEQNTNAYWSGSDHVIIKASDIEDPFYYSNSTLDISLRMIARIIIAVAGSLASTAIVFAIVLGALNIAVPLAIIASVLLCVGLVPMAIHYVRSTELHRKLLENTTLINKDV